MLQAVEERPIATEPDTGINAFNQGQPFFLEIFFQGHPFFLEIFNQDQPFFLDIF